MTIKHFRGFAALAFSLLTLTASAVVPTEEIRQKGSNYYAYPYPANQLPQLTPAPAGYEPFHIEHYGRHGSRWHIGKNAYNRPVEYLLPAERNGKLTPRGVELMAQLRKYQKEAATRDGELTQVGADQHRGIARRMMANFPEVFADSARIDARSSVVIRCILSMDNELQEMKAANPRLRVTSDASEGDMRYIANDDIDGMDGAYYNAYVNYASEHANAFSRVHPVEFTFLDEIISDPQFAKDSIKASSLYHYLFIIAANAQSHYDMPVIYDILDEEGINRRWLYNNVSWYTRDGNTRLNGNLQPYTQQSLLRNFIESADTALNNGGNGANLRFGHEVIVLPFVSLLELDDYGKEWNDMEKVAPNWKNYEVFPMGANIQMVFYRPVNNGEGDVLVKVLLNEKEARFPVKTDTYPYYKWNDVRQYYLDKLSKIPSGHPAPAKYEVGSKVAGEIGIASNGVTVGFNKYKGKKLALVFCPQGGGKDTKKMIASLEENASRLKKAGWNVVCVTPDSPETLAAFAEKENVSLPLVSDMAHYVSEDFGLWKITGKQKKKDAQAGGVTTSTEDEKSKSKAKMGVDPSLVLINKKGVVEKIKEIKHESATAEEILD